MQPNRTRLTAARVEAFTCPAGKSQAFLWDTEAPALLLRATPAGRKTYAVEARLNGKTLRLTIGDVRTWPLGEARSEAARLKMLVDSGTDPRELERQQRAEREAQRQQEEAQAVTVGTAWAAYIAERRPHWGERHYGDNLRAAAPGVKKPGTLHHLMALRLADLDAPTIEAWAAREGQTRPTQARLALRLLRAFLNWCTEHPAYGAMALS